MSFPDGYGAEEPDDDLFEDLDDDTPGGSLPNHDEESTLQDAGMDEMGDLLKEGMTGEDIGFDLQNLNDANIVFDQSGKAKDAVDYGDLDSDEELPDEEITQDTSLPDLPSYTDPPLPVQDDFDDDDLFGDQDGEINFMENPDIDTKDVEAHESEGSVASEHNEQLPRSILDLDDDLDPDTRAELAQQRRLLQDLEINKASQELDEQFWDLMKQEFPRYSQDKTPYWSELLPYRRLQWVGKTPLRPPKTVRPTKISLELDTDDKAVFNSAAHLQRRTSTTEDGVVHIEVSQDVKEEDVGDDILLTDDEEIGGFTMEDLAYLCTDIEVLSPISDSESTSEHVRGHQQDINMYDDADFAESHRPAKKSRLGMSPKDIASTFLYDVPTFDDPEKATRKLAQRVVLDLNDPKLLLEDIDRDATQSRGRPGDRSAGPQTVKEILKERFATSNDAEYDLLKQNLQHKVRGQLGHLTVDHSVPALRLQYPYYKLRLNVSETRLFHRGRTRFKHLLFSFAKPGKLKRKVMRTKSAKEAYASTKDLSPADNSTVLLFEYSEEHPLFLSSTGMGVRVVNYYRRKTKDDTTRPKKDLGETQVLLPEDKSPFYMLGHVDPGETVSALYNSMFRAPIFEHNVSPKDFLVVREETHLGGSRYHLRNVDHMFAVGQELPSMQIPGPHARLVTAAHKNRLRAICFRIARRKKNHRIRVEEVTKHFKGTTDIQNRQKMKEFMSHSKEHKEWEMKDGEAVPDEEYLQNLITPEIICQLDSMYAGQQALNDAGYGYDDDDDDDEGGEKQSLEQNLAPWRLTKNFEAATLNKAMLTLHGEGDPSGRGEAFSFMKTSMKGGYRSQGAPVQDRLDTDKRRQAGGHSYNVADQQRLYEQDIRRIWNNQKRSLQFEGEVEDDSVEDGVDGQDDSIIVNGQPKGGNTSINNTPAPFRRIDDETATSFSKRSTGSQSQKFLVISRMTLENGVPKWHNHTETNAAVIKSYTRQKRSEELERFEYANMDPSDLK